jgi:ADP-dependent NAD(P)H-hydrate dehydratase / NAD(P)H-hydrate epimerase
MSLPRWMEPLLEAGETKELDRWAMTEKDIPAETLMERAGEGLAGVVARRAPAGRIAVVCGKGNNGGDGLVAARHLRAAGRDVDVLLVWPAESIGEAAQAQLARLPGPAPVAFDGGRLHRAHAIVDALLGTGSAGSPRSPADTVIEEMEAAKAPVVAADVPSGVDASTGEVAGPAVHCVATATFHGPKLGLYVAPGKGYAGDVETIDIGIPRGGPVRPQAGLIGSGVLAEMPRRGAASTKFTSGNVFIIGGSRGLTGAPCMAALAAMRAGAGYVTVGAPASLELSFTVRLLEAMMVALPEDGDGHLDQAGVEPVLEAVARADAVVLGPGISKDPDAQALVRAVAPRIDAPLLIDADGINALAGRFEDVLRRRRRPTVLTPHAGELGRLLGVESSEIERARLWHARDAAARAKAFVVLKGDDTIVAAPSGRVAVSRGGAPGLATAGTGDVLSGVIGAMLAKGMPVATAACAGVHAHLRAGQLAAAPHGPDAVIASDVIAALPAALSA